MNIVNIHEAKTHFSKLINDVLAGKDIVIAKAGVPVVKLVAYKEQYVPRIGGQLEGVLKISDDFDTPLPKEVLGSFYGEESSK